MTPAKTNRHGRRGTRGLRPWLLIPKVLAVAVFFGATVAAAAIWFSSDWANLPPADPARLATLQTLHRLFVWLIVPAAVAASVPGVGLTLEAPSVMLRQRWLQVKLLLLAVGMPGMHLYMAYHLETMRDAVAVGSPGPDAGRLHAGFILLLLGSGVIIVLGRLKPRLGQNWARVYQRIKPAARS